VQADDVTRKIDQSTTKTFSLWYVHAMNGRHATRKGNTSDFFHEKFVMVEELFVAPTITHVPFGTGIVIKPTKRRRIYRKVD
jgi:hypothetical protein